MLDLIIEDYQALLEDLDKKCRETQKGLPMIPCPQKCFDCCKQVFPISFLEAYYLSVGFHEIERSKRRKLLRKAEKMLNKLANIEGQTFETQNSKWEEVMKKRQKYSKYLNNLESDCPFLDEGLCTVYKHRNHDCRVHGYSFDSLTREIIACFRFPKLFPTSEKFMEKAFDYNYRYQEKLKLDQKLIVYLTSNPAYKNILYLTHPFIPLLKNYQTINWTEFFAQKVPNQIEPDKFSLIIDSQSTWNF